jgi:hypothetical protein
VRPYIKSKPLPNLTTQNCPLGTSFALQSPLSFSLRQYTSVSLVLWLSTARTSPSSGREPTLSCLLSGEPSPPPLLSLALLTGANLTAISTLFGVGNSDFISLILQAGGGTIVSMADNKEFGDMGLHIMQAGLAFQVASLLGFILLCCHFAHACHRRRDEQNPRLAKLRALRRFRFFLWSESSRPLYCTVLLPPPETKLRKLTKHCVVAALSIATIAMLTRCAFRIAELSEGFHGDIWYNEVDYMVLEGAMVSLCVILLTVGHPGVCFAGQYHEADFQLRGGKTDARRRVTLNGWLC